MTFHKTGSQFEGGDVNSGRTVLALCLRMTVLLCLSITRQSLWIDEAWTAWFAVQDSLRNLISAAAQFKTSDVQTPLYVLYIWGWARVFGTGEYALRASNIPFVLIFVIALGWTSLRVFGRPIFWSVFCFSPFMVYYMNEARSPVAVMGCATVTMGALLAYFADRGRYGRVASWVCSSALVITCGVEMLGAFLVPVLVVYAALVTREKKLDRKAVLHEWSKPLLVSLPLLLVLGAFYGWTVLAGYGGIRGKPGLGNTAFAAWEFMGLAGLGPPRNQLRLHRSLQTLVPYWPWLAIGILACAAALGTTTRRLLAHRRKRPSWSLLLALVTAMTLFLVVAAVVRFDFRGRHLAVFFPGLVLAVIQVTSEVGERTRLWTSERVAFMVLVVAWAISDARIVGHPRYYKDDYRFAAAFALDEAGRTGGTVLWAADPIGGRYYGIELGQPKPGVVWPVRGKGLFAANWTDRQVKEYVASREGEGQTILVLSKPDLYDRQGAWAAAVKGMDARKIASANSFDIYAFKCCESNQPSSGMLQP